MTGLDRAGCPFCEYLEGRTECAFVAREAEVAAIVNRAAFAPGALLVLPIRHVESVLEIDDTTLASVHLAAARMARALVRAYGASGINVFQNNGADAGQTVPHLHVHVVPRQPGGDPRHVFSERNAGQLTITEQLETAARVRAAL